MGRDRIVVGDYVECRNMPFKGATGHVVDVGRKWWMFGRRAYTVHLDGQTWTGGKRARGLTNVRKVSDEEAQASRGEV